MAGRPPDIVVYVSDKEGNQNFKESTIALWLVEGKTDNNDNPFWTGRISKDEKGSDRWVCAYKVVPKEGRGSSRDDEAAKATPESSGPKDTQEDVPF